MKLDGLQCRSGVFEIEKYFVSARGIILKKIKLIF
jgi:hypothetical protein